MALTAEELDTYRRDGLVKPACGLPEGVLASMRAALDDLLAATPDLASEGLVTPHLPGAYGLPAVQTDRWLGFCTHPGILDMVEAVIGPDIILWGSQVFCKPSRVGMEVPWHQDGEYWPIRPLATCSVWIALDDVTPENGAMRYIPGSHRERRLFAHATSDRTDRALDREIDPACFDPASALYDDLPAGGLSLHDVYLIHGSAANRSGKRRAAFVIRYMPATSYYDRAAVTSGGSPLIDVKLRERPLFLLRGQERTGRTDLSADLRP
jgi:Phytanoyl-CoA dioxygenase (PhyH)